MTNHNPAKQVGFYGRLDFALANGLTEPAVYRMLRMNLVEVVLGLAGPVLSFAGGMSRQQAEQIYTAVVLAESVQDAEPASDADADDDCSWPRLSECPTLWV